MKNLLLSTIMIIALAATSCSDDSSEVISREVNSLQIRPKTIDPIRVGDKIKLNLEILPLNAVYESIDWSSENEDVITVNDDGEITAIDEGLSAITAIASNGVSSTIYVEVLHTFRVPEELVGYWRAYKVFMQHPDAPDPDKQYNEKEIKELFVPNYFHGTPEEYVENIKHIFSYEIHKEDGSVDCIFNQTDERIPGFVRENSVDIETSTFPCYFLMNMLQYKYFPAQKYISQKLVFNEDEIVIKHPMETGINGYYITHYKKVSK